MDFERNGKETVREARKELDRKRLKHKNLGVSGVSVRNDLLA